MLKKLFLAVMAAGLMATSGAASAQDYPNRPMTMVIPFAAGGPTDVLRRVLAQRMSEILGQQVVVENVGGAGGQTGSKRVEQAKPDGYTFVLGTVGTHAQSQTLYAKPLYNVVNDFTPVALLAEVPIILTVRKDLPVKDFREFVAYAQKNQSKMQFGSAGAGSATHLGCVLLNYLLKTNINHIPYKGTGPAMIDLAAGRIDHDAGKQRVSRLPGGAHIGRIGRAEPCGERLGQRLADRGVVLLLHPVVNVTLCQLAYGGQYRLRAVEAVHDECQCGHQLVALLRHVG